VQSLDSLITNPALAPVLSVINTPTDMFLGCPLLGPRAHA
jgi:hypothetical protein